MFMGVYRTRAEADQAAQSLKNRKFRRSDVLKYPYGIQVGAYRKLEVIEEVETDLLKKGLLGYRIPHEDGMVRLLIGAYENKTSTQPLLTTLKEQGYSPLVVER